MNDILVCKNSRQKYSSRVVFRSVSADIHRRRKKARRGSFCYLKVKRFGGWICISIFLACQLPFFSLLEFTKKIHRKPGIYVCILAIYLSSISTFVWFSSKITTIGTNLGGYNNLQAVNYVSYNLLHFKKYTQFFMIWKILKDFKL